MYAYDVVKPNFVVFKKPSKKLLFFKTPKHKQHPEKLFHLLNQYF